MSDLSEVVKQLTADEKIALLGFLVGRLSKYKQFQESLVEGANIFRGVDFDHVVKPELSDVDLLIIENALATAVGFWEDAGVEVPYEEQVQKKIGNYLLRKGIQPGNIDYSGPTPRPHNF